MPTSSSTIPGIPRRQASAHCLAAILCVVVLAACAGCGSVGGRQPVRTEIQPFSPAEAELWDVARSAEYTFRIGDVFDISFKYDKELDQKDVQVLPDGRMSISSFENVYVVGLTVSQVDSLITAAFAKDYIAPDLTIIMQEFGKSAVYVLGSVNKPGEYDLPEFRGGVLQAVAAAGGFDRTASSSEVLLIRATPEGFLYRHFDLSHLEKQGLPSAEALDLRPYDIIYVPRSPVGDLAAFSEQVLGSVLRFSDLFWDVYAISNLDKINSILR
ncbi:MAG: polysaccharide biosynthesis/export family protein [Candidatus Latescibacteria bacterium]|nr:polysaccharide biosynthesis/export family protein [Candidatus Latescibacterota bacterium]